jgi:membrane-bound lytic murein transglycosylase B
LVSVVNRFCLRALAALGALAVAAALPTSGQAAAAPVASTRASAAAGSTAHASLAPELAAVVVDSPKFRSESASFNAALAAYDVATATIADSTNQLSHLVPAQTSLEARVRTTTDQQAVVADHLDALVKSRRELAVRSYIAGNGTTAFQALDPATGTQAGSDQVLERTASERTLADQSATRAHLDAVTHTLANLTSQRDAVASRVAIQTTRLQDAVAAQTSAASDIVTRHVAYTDARALATIKGTDLTLVAMDAYWKAAAAESIDDPQCGIQWWGVAGIGRVESYHGTFGGAHLDAGGEVSKPIIGIALDGTDGTAVIGDSDGGALDGDPTVDRAVGPMQFIPSTWRAWGRDGNGDGKKDPENIYDAALAAAGYLCHAGNLGSDAGLTQAYLSYNASDVYASEVLGFAHSYEKVRIPPPPPLPTDGPLATLLAGTAGPAASG